MLIISARTGRPARRSIRCAECLPAIAREAGGDYTNQTGGPALDTNNWWADALDDELRAVNWTAYRDQLAGGIPAHDFTTIDGAFSKVATLQRTRATGVKFADMRTSAEDARGALVDAGGRIIKASHGRREARKEARESDPLTDYPT